MTALTVTEGYMCDGREMPSHGILSYFGHIQNYLKMVGNLKITV